MIHGQTLPSPLRRCGPHPPVVLALQTLLVWFLALFLLFGGGGRIAQAGENPRAGTFQIVDQTIPLPLTDQPGDPIRGRAVLLARDKGNCVACHAVPLAEGIFPGTVGPDLRGIGQRLSAAALRLRLVDPRVLSADGQSLMPAFYSVGGLTRVAKAYQGKTILDAQEIEDLIALLTTF